MVSFSFGLSIYDFLLTVNIASNPTPKSTKSKSTKSKSIKSKSTKSKSKPKKRTKSSKSSPKIEELFLYKEKLKKKMKQFSETPAFYYENHFF
jgi:hypothetical protein